MSEGAPGSMTIRAAGLALPLVFALSVVAAALLAGAGAALGAGLAALVALAAFVLMAWSMRRRALDGRKRLPAPERAALRFQIFNGLWVVAFVLSFVFIAPLAAETEQAFERFAYLAAPAAALAVLEAGLPGLASPQGWMLLPAFATLYAPVFALLQRGGE